MVKAVFLHIDGTLMDMPISVTQVIPATINTPFFDKARTKLGVKPVAPPPIYLPGIVPEAIFRVAENPAQDLVIEGAAKAAIFSQASRRGCWAFYSG